MTQYDINRETNLKKIYAFRKPWLGSANSPYRIGNQCLVMSKVKQNKIVFLSFNFLIDYKTYNLIHYWYKSFYM